MTVTFFPLFSKRLNSTKRPVMAPDPSPDVKVEFDCKLKENCSEHDPVLMLATDNLSYTYAYIADWSKYYFVIDALSVHKGLAEYHLTEDFLASYKSAISNTSARIVFAASAVRDPLLVDPRIQIYNSRTGNYSSNINNVFSGSAGYILTVFNTVNSVAGSSGMSMSYLMSEAGMAKARNWLSMNGIQSAITQFMNGNLTSAIFNLIWVPYFDELVNGGYATHTSSLAIANSRSWDDSEVFFNNGELYTINSHPIIQKTISIARGLRYTDFRKFEPYTTSAIFLPGIGTISLSNNEWQNSNIDVKVYIEALTGDLKYQLVNTVGTIITEANCNIAAQCPYGQMMTNASGMMNGIGQAVGSAVSLVASIGTAVATEGATAPLVAASAVGMITGVANTVLSANQHTASISGGHSNRLGSVMPTIRYFELAVDTEDPTDATYVATHGYPYAGTAQINSFSGYVQCEGASVAAYANNNELEAINNYLNTGFYYE